MITIEVQHFHGCPNSVEMIKRVREAITRSEVEIAYKEVLVDTPEKAELYKFRGSPTVLVNGIDLEGLPKPETGNLACRYYNNGIPSVETMINAIENCTTKER
jgi:hypothetical protein